MKKTFRSVLTFVLALVMMVTCMVGTAFAKSSDSTTIEGSVASANVSNTRTSATATTKYGGSTSAYVYAKVTAYYESGEFDYYRTAPGDLLPGYSAASVTISIGGAQVRGAAGAHEVHYGAHHWTPNTSSGILLQGAIPG